MQDNDPVLDVWRPANGEPAVLICWLMTEWCNYRCPYCPQTHGRREPKGDGFTAHCFDNQPLQKWQEAFQRHFGDKRLSLVLTGGEPMVDRKNMVTLLNWFSANQLCECIRIDTNASWKPHLYEVDPTKIVLMCTFHPSEVDEADFIARLQDYRRAGFRIGMVNYVMNKANGGLFLERRKAFADLGFLLHPNPLWVNTHEPEELALMREVLPDIDFRYRSRSESPKGLPCRYPMLSYELDYRGWIIPGCLPERGDWFFAEALPKGPQMLIPCPHPTCMCLFKYSFLESCERNISLDPLSDYAAALWAR